MSFPTLQDIASKYKELAKAGAPVDTGKLRDSIATSYKKLSDTQYQFDLNMVSYGLWWNSPPPIRSKRRRSLAKRKEFNFAKRAANDKGFKNMINSYVKADIDVMVNQKLQQAFAKGGYSKIRQSFGK